MVRQVEREDLGGQFALITRRLIAAERPLLEAQGLTMWEYVVLSQLRTGPMPSQVELAQAIGYDKTRLIALLDGLVEAGHVRREPDPRDRRARVVELTARGRRTVEAARKAIHAMEDELLAGMSATQRRALDQALGRLR